MTAKPSSACQETDAVQGGYMGFANLDRLDSPAGRGVADRAAEAWTQLKNTAA